MTYPCRTTARPHGGFGLRDIVHNFVSGLILIFERPVKVGDLVEITDTMGHVTRIGARSTTVRTFNGAEIIVPNGNLISSNLTNWTLSDEKRRAEIVIPVALGTDPNRVTKILEDTARETQAFVYETAAKAETDLLEKLKAAGMQVNTPDKDAFIAASKPVYDEFGAEVKGAKEMIEKAIALGK